MKTLKIDSTGTEVRVAQLLLQYSQDTGTFDQAFQTHVQQWQASKNLTQDGVIGDETWEVIANNAPKVSTSCNRKSQAAKALQLLIGVDADGIFGPKSRLALRNYQSANGLTVDGICGPQTWKKILDISTATGDIIISCEDLKQFAKPHGPKTYGPDSSYSTYANGGCGVTSFAVVQRAYGLADADETASETIERLGEYAWQHDFRPKGAGTRAGLFSTNGTKATTTRNATAIENAIREGKLVILLIYKGFDNGYTGSGF